MQRKFHVVLWNALHTQGISNICFVKKSISDILPYQGTNLYNCFSWESLCRYITNLNSILSLKVKVSKCTFYPRTGHEGPGGECMYSSTLSLTSALDGGVWSTPHPGRFTPEKRPGTHLQELDEIQGPSGRVRNVSPPPGFDPRTVQSVATSTTPFRPTVFFL
jgi:rRNA maturation protein Nop10